MQRWRARVGLPPRPDTGSAPGSPEQGRTFNAVARRASTWAAPQDHFEFVEARLHERRVARENTPLAAPHERARHINIHRDKADLRTRGAVERMLEVFGTPSQQEADSLIADIAAFIRAEGRYAQAGIPTSDDDDRERNAAALATLFGERGPHDEWYCITAPEQPYYIGEAANHSEPAKVVCAGLWRAIQSLKADERLPAHTLFVNGLAASREPETLSGNPGHTCRPGQFQQLATHLQPFFTGIIRIVPSLEGPRTLLRLFSAWIKREHPHKTPEDLSQAQRLSVYARAHEVWKEFRITDRGLLAEGLLTRQQAQERMGDMEDGLHTLCDFYELEWARPSTPPRSASPSLLRYEPNDADDFEFLMGLDDDDDDAFILTDADSDTDEEVGVPREPEDFGPGFLMNGRLNDRVLAMPRPPRFNAFERIGAAPKPTTDNGGEKTPTDLIRELIDGYEAQCPDVEARQEAGALRLFWEHALQEARKTFINRPEMGEFEQFLNTYMLFEYNFRHPA